VKYPTFFLKVLNIMADSKYTTKRNFTKEHSFKGSGKITAIKVQKTNAERVNIFIDECYAFSLTALVVAERRLKPGIELSDSDVAELQAADLYHLGLSAALELLSRRPRSEAEVRQRLKRRYPEGSPETFTRVIERLKELNYLNDADFARYWIENRAAFAPRGRLLLKQELLRLGVDREIVDSALEQYLEAASDAQEATEGEETGLSLEESQCLAIARKKARSYAGEDWAGFYRKLGGFLLRRGYDYGLAGRITKQVWKELKGQLPESDDID
jgi:regulatory protein